jgi:hypothetical protein
MEILLYTILGFFAVTTVRSAFGRDQRVAYQLLPLLRPRHVIANIPAMFIVGATMVVLLRVPGLSWGWFQLLGGNGNVALGMTETATGWAATAVPAAMITIFVCAAPVLVRLEEVMFRSGSERRTLRQRVVLSIVFGLVHISAGIPIAAALALSIAGWWFTCCYLAGVRDHRRGTTFQPRVRAAKASDPAEVRMQELEQRLTAFVDEEQTEDAGLQAASLAHLAWNYTLIAVLVTTFVL